MSAPITDMTGRLSKNDSLLVSKKLKNPKASLSYMTRGKFPACLRLEMYGDDAVTESARRLFYKKLETDQQIQRLDISWCRPGESMDAFCVMLEKNSSIEELNVRFWQIGAAAAEVSNALSKNTRLKIFQCADADLKDEGIAALANMLCTNTTLELLDLRTNDIHGKGLTALAAALQQNKSLCHLGLYANFLDETDHSGVHALAAALPFNQSLRVLDMRNMLLNAGCAVALAKALVANNTLEELHLQDNPFGNEGVTALASSLKVNSSLRVLVLKQTEFDETGAKQLAECLEVNHGLQVLNIAYNFICDEGLAAIADAVARNTTLHELEMQGVMRTETPVLGITALAHMLTVNPTLERLRLYAIPLFDEGVTAVANALKSPSSALRYLDLGMNAVCTAGFCALADMLKTNTTLETLHTVPMDTPQDMFPPMMGMGGSCYRHDIANCLDATSGAAIADAMRHNSTLRTLTLFSFAQDFGIAKACLNDNFTILSCSDGTGLDLWNSILPRNNKIDADAKAMRARARPLAVWALRATPIPRDVWPAIVTSATPQRYFLDVAIAKYKQQHLAEAGGATAPPPPPAAPAAPSLFGGRGSASTHAAAKTKPATRASVAAQAPGPAPMAAQTAATASAAKTAVARTAAPPAAPKSAPAPAPTAKTAVAATPAAAAAAVSVSGRSLRKRPAE